MPALYRPRATTRLQLGAAQLRSQKSTRVYKLAGSLPPLCRHFAATLPVPPHFPIPAVSWPIADADTYHPPLAPHSGAAGKERAASEAAAVLYHALVLTTTPVNAAAVGGVGGRGLSLCLQHTHLLLLLPSCRPASMLPHRVEACPTQTCAPCPGVSAAAARRRWRLVSSDAHNNAQ